MTTHRLPTWLADGPEVSTLAYQIVCEAFGDPVERPKAEPLARSAVGMVELIEALAERLDVDEADVLRGLAELERVGVLTGNPKARHA